MIINNPALSITFRISGFYIGYTAYVEYLMHVRACFFESGVLKIWVDDT